MPCSSAVRGRGALASAPQNLHSLQPLSLCLSVLSLRPCEAALGSPLFLRLFLASLPSPTFLSLL